MRFQLNETLSSHDDTTRRIQIPQRIYKHVNDLYQLAPSLKDLPLSALPSSCPNHSPPLHSLKCPPFPPLTPPPPSLYPLQNKYNMGKVHGSLARAGKVKGQTPKVEAGEKKKQPRGRAKKRMQYNRRYVNVVTGMGGRQLGPNSNADKMK